ncbi:MAG: energy transducer TonB [Acidobacteriota bacterium]
MEKGPTVQRTTVLLALMLALTSISSAQMAQTERTIPLLQEAALPTYPAIWRAARISGKVVAAVTIKEGKVVDVQRKSGNPYLFYSTEQNIKTWRFGDAVNTAFDVTFTYEMTDNESDAPTNPTVTILPTLDVLITARPVKPTVNYDIQGKGSEERQP